MVWDIDSWNVYHSVVYSNDRWVFSEMSLWKYLFWRAFTEKKALPNSDIWSKFKFTTKINGTQSSTLGNENTKNDHQGEVMIDNAILSTALWRNVWRLSKREFVFFMIPSQIDNKTFFLSGHRKTRHLKVTYVARKPFLMIIRYLKSDVLFKRT